MTLSELLNDRQEAQALIAARAGVAQTTVSSWIRGASLPPRTRIPYLAAALGMDAGKLAALVARERSQRVVGGGQRRVVVGGRSHGAGSRRQPTPAGGRKGGRS